MVSLGRSEIISSSVVGVVDFCFCRFDVLNILICLLHIILVVSDQGGTDAHAHVASIGPAPLFEWLSGLPELPDVECTIFLTVRYRLVCFGRRGHYFQWHAGSYVPFCRDTPD